MNERACAQLALLAPEERKSHPVIAAAAAAAAGVDAAVASGEPLRYSIDMWT